MTLKQKLFTCSYLLAGLWLFFSLSVAAQDYAALSRLRPAAVYLENVTVAIRVTTASGGPSHLQERVRELLVADLLGANRTLRENNNAPQAVVQCSLTRLTRNQSQETRTVLLAGKVNYTIVNATLEAAYTARHTRGNQTIDAETISAKYTKEFQNGQGVPTDSQIEDDLIKQVVTSIVKRLANTEEKFRVRLMRRGELSSAIRLAQANQWQQFIDALRALPDKPKDQQYEGDRKYDIGLAYEALGYGEMSKNPDQAEKYFDLSERYYREAMETDKREKEYGRGLERMNEGRGYVSIAKTRNPPLPANLGGGKDIAGGGSAMTNKDVIKMVKANLPEDIILDAIRQAKQKKFDTGTDSLIELKNQGVSPTIIREMMNSRGQ